VRRIVVAVDGSEPSHRAAAFAVTLAVREGARVTCCSAIDPTAAYVAAAEGAPIGFGDTLAALREEARGYCEEAIAIAAARGLDAESVVLEGKPPAALELFAEQHGAGAIVVGTHGRRGLARAVIGSVACAIVRSARVPVFTVRADAAVDADGPIVVAVDASQPSLAALHVAIALARSEHTALHLVHVFDTHDRQPMAAATDNLEEIGDRARAEGVAFASELCEGDPVAQTIAAAARVNARFIATGTHTRSALGRIVAGSFAEKLMRDAPIPVMTVRV
jgi:nucleotide-binding universal stress UspA family protein